MNQQVIYDAMHIRDRDFSRVQDELGVTFQQGHRESLTDFRTRVLTEIDNMGKMRDLEHLLAS